MRVSVLASGSKGNAIFVEMDGARVLVDAGVGVRRVTRELCELSVTPESLDAMLYRRRNGQKPRPCETPEEREEKIRAWSKR